MSEIVNNVAGGAGLDAFGIEAGLRRVDEAFAKTGKNLDNLEASAKQVAASVEDVSHALLALETSGDGAGAAARQIELTATSLAEAIARITKPMAGAAKAPGGPRESQANEIGRDGAAASPETRARTEGIGQSASELAALRAQQLDAGSATAEMSQRLREQEEAGTSAFGRLSKMAGGFRNALQTVASYATHAAGAGAALMKGAIDDLAELDDMAQKTGSAVENLSRVQKVAGVFGADMGTIEGALARLSGGMQGIGDDSAQVQSALAALGVSSTDAVGNLRDPSDVLVEAANKLQGYNDGASKAALVTDLLSKSGVGLLPFLGQLSENYDKVSGTSSAAAGAASQFQEQLGWLKLQFAELVTNLTASALPALTDLAGAFLDVFKQQTSLDSAESGKWADDLGLGIAEAADAAVILGRAVSVVWNALKAVRADLKLVSTIADNANPAKVGIKLWNGGNPVEDVRKAFRERNGIVEEANKNLEELLNRPTGQFRNAYLARQSDRKEKPAAPTDVKPKGDLQYPLKRTEPPKRAGAAKEVSTGLDGYNALLNRINGKSADIDPDFHDNMLKLHAGYKAGSQTLEAYVATVEKYIAQQPFATKAEQERLRAQKESSELQDAAIGLSAKRIDDAKAEAARNEELARTYGMTKSAVEQLELAQLEGQLAQRAANGLTSDQVDKLKTLIDAKKRSAAAVLKVDGMDAVKKAGEDLDRFLDPGKAQNFGETLKGAFGAAGESISKMFTALDAYGTRQGEIDKARKDAAVRYAHDAKGYADASAAITEKEVQSRLNGYGDMAAAAKGFFAEGSKGYSVLSSVEKAFRAAEQAMALQAMTKKIFFKQSEVTANTALNATKITGEGVTTAASTSLAATEASAWGVTAVVKAIASLPFPLNLAAGAATLAAVVGIGAKMFGGVGGSGLSLSESRQENQGTGTVLGSDAKSESIANSLDMIESATLQGLGISNGMLTSLRKIEAGISQFASLLVRTTGVTGDFGAEFSTRGSADAFGRSTSGVLASAGIVGIALDKLTGGWVGKITGSVLSKVFGGKTTVEDTGFTFNKIDFAGIAAGRLNALQYADIKKDGGLFRKDKYDTKTQGLGEEGNRQISAVLMSLYDTVFEAGKMLDISADGFAAQLNGFVLDVGKVSLKGLSDDDIQKELEAVFSKVGDDLARFGVAGLEQYQQVGEGYLETLTRVAANYQAVTVVTESMGMTFGLLGLASVGARERLIDLVGGLDEFTSGADQFLADFYTDQERADSLRARIAPTLDQFGIKTGTQDALQQFRNVVTGLDLSTEAGARAYATLMQIAPAFKQIADVDANGLEKQAEVAKNRRELEIQIMGLTGDKAAELAAQRALELDGVDASLLPLLRRVHALQDEQAALDTSNSLLGIQAQIYEITGDKAGAASVLAQQHANALAALDPALRGATQNLWGLQAAAKASDLAKAEAATLMGDADAAFSVMQRVVERQKQALQDDIQVRTESVAKLKSMSDALRSTLDGMRTPEQQEADSLSARAQIAAALAIARAGGPLPDSEKLQRTLEAIGNGPVMESYATLLDYQRDVFGTQGDLEELANLTDGALTVEEKSLKTLEDQVKQYDLMLERYQEQIDVLKGISVTGLSIEQAMFGLQSALAATKANPVVSATAAITDTYKSVLGRAPDAPGLNYWLDRAAAGVSQDDIAKAIKGSAEAQVQALYHEIFDRAADDGGLQFYVAQMDKGISIAEVRQALLSSDEAKKLRGFAVGANRVPYDMPAFIHEDERIIPAADNRELMRRLASPADPGRDAEFAQMVRAVGEMQTTMFQVMYQVAKNTSRSATSLENMDRTGMEIREETSA